VQQQIGLRGHRVQDPEHAEARRREVLLAAARCFARNGYDATTLDHIAEEMGTTKGLIYYYFSKKEEVYAEIRATAIRDAIQRLEAIVAAGGPPEHVLACAIHDLVEHIFLGLDQYANVLHEPHALGPENRQRVRDLSRRYERIMEGIIVRGIESGVFFPGIPRLMTFTVLRATLGVASWYAPNGELAPDVIALHVTRQVLASVLREGNAAAQPILSTLSKTAPVPEHPPSAI